MEERVPEMAPMEGVTAQGLTDQLLEEENMQLEEEGAALEAEIREAIGELFEDGWTAEELAAFSQDPSAQEAIANGHSVARAACAYLRAKSAVIRRRGVPTARKIAASAF